MSRAIVVVPCYNEALRLDLDALRSFAREHPDPRFLFVNDGSTDGTRSCSTSCTARLPSASSSATCTRMSARPRRSARACSGPLRRARIRRLLGRRLRDAPARYPDVLLDPGLPARSRDGLRRPGSASRPFRGPRAVCGIISGGSSRVRPRWRWGSASTTRNAGRSSSAYRPRSSPLFQAPFRTRWIFDVEILARVMAARRGTGRSPRQRDDLRVPPPRVARCRGLQAQASRHGEGVLRPGRDPLELREGGPARGTSPGRADPRKAACGHRSDLGLDHGRPLNPSSRSRTLT